MKDSEFRRRSLSRIRSIAPRLVAEAPFLRALLDNPLRTGALTPSSRVLAAAIALRVDPERSGVVIELGPGTGRVTEALVKRGLPPERLLLIEFDLGLCNLLRRRFPRARIIQGDAYQLRSTLSGEVLPAGICAIVSGLPLLTRPERQRISLLREALKMMDEDGRFIQFSYGAFSPIPLSRDGGFSVQASSPVWRNMPPARIWVYRRSSRDVLHPKIRAAALTAKAHQVTNHVARKRHSIEQNIAATARRFRERWNEKR